MGSRRAVVVGGGITGTLCAHRLLTAGWDVVLAEAQVLGAGSSSRTAAGIRQQFSTAGTVCGMRFSVKVYKEWAERVGGDCPIEQAGYLFLYGDSDSWAAARARAAQQRAWGLTDVEDLEIGELRKRFGWVSEDAVLGGTWCPSDGFLRPELIYQDAGAACERLGGRVLRNAPVVAASHAGGRLVAVDTPKGRLEGDLFLDCTNAWTPRVGAILGGEPLPVAAYKRYLWFLGRGGFDAEAFAAMPLVITPSGAYCRPENRETLMVGWAHDARDEVGFSYDDQDEIEPAFFHKSGVDARPFEAWMALAEAIEPAAELAGISATTAGFYGTTPDHNPFLDVDPRVPNLLRLVGFSGHGAMFGPFTAEVAVALAEAGGSLERVDLEGSPVELDPFRIGRELGHSEAMVI